MSPIDIITLSFLLCEDLEYKDPIQMIACYLHRRVDLYMQIFMYYLQYKQKVQSLLEGRLEFNTCLHKYNLNQGDEDVNALTLCIDNIKVIFMTDEKIREGQKVFTALY